VDALVERDRGSERLYVQQDANWNVTAIVSSAGVVQERYVYDPYGKAVVLDPVAWTVRGSGVYGTSNFGWVYLHQGGRYTSFGDLSGLYNFRNRDYSPTLGRWMEEDPIRYEAVDSNLYGYVGGNAPNQVDPLGLEVTTSTGDQGQITISYTGPGYQTFQVTQVMQIEVTATYNCPDKDDKGQDCVNPIDKRLPPGYDIGPKPKPGHEHPHPHQSGNPYQPQFFNDPVNPGQITINDQTQTAQYFDQPNAALVTFPQAASYFPDEITRDGKKCTLVQICVVQRFVTTVYVGGLPQQTIHWTSTSCGPKKNPSFPKCSVRGQLKGGKDPNDVVRDWLNNQMR
jgi:RHS repeat-associated protein